MSTPQGAAPIPPAINSTLPSWVQPVVQITTTLGVPTVFAAVLLWFVLFKVGGTLDMIQQQEETRTKIVAATEQGLVVALERQTVGFQQALERQTAAFEKAIDKNIETNRTIAERLYQKPPTP